MAHRNHRRSDRRLGRVLRVLDTDIKAYYSHSAASLEAGVRLIGFEDPRKQVRVHYRSRVAPALREVFYGEA